MSEHLVESPAEIKASIRAFNADASKSKYQPVARALLAQTTYWAHDPQTGQFGPSKFVGLSGVSLATYRTARMEVSGTDTRLAIEKAVGRPFQDRPWAARLRAWGEALFGPNAFGDADETKWQFLSLDAEAAGVTLPLKLHGRYGRKEIFASVGETYSQQEPPKNTGLSPRCSDGGHFIFITLNKDDFDPAYDYADELGTDWLAWVTRRDRSESHPEYVHLRKPTTRKSLFVRNESREDFAYLGELDYIIHEPAPDPRDGRDQQEYLFHLREAVPDQLLAELTAGVPVARSPKTPPKNALRPPKLQRDRRPATLGDYKLALSYALGRLERTIVPAHHNYQVRLRKFLDSKGVDATWERNFVDVEFTLGGQRYIGEIKVTTTLRLEEAFRMALGQLLEYAHLRYDKQPRMVMLLDAKLDQKRIDLASAFEIAVIAEVEAGYLVQNAQVCQDLASLFARK